MTLEVTREEGGPTHPPSATKLAAVDFDGTIAPWGSMFSFPEPLPGAVKAVQRLKAAGYTVFIFTSRLSSYWHNAEGWDTREATAKQVEYIREYCEKYDIPADFATAEKIPAEVYLDDKAMRVDENDTLLTQVEQFISSGLFVFIPTSRGGRWHRAKSEPELVERTSGWGQYQRTYKRWEVEPVCGQNLAVWMGEGERDFYDSTSKWSPFMAKSRGPEAYCLFCLAKDRKREAGG